MRDVVNSCANLHGELQEGSIDGQQFNIEECCLHQIMLYVVLTMCSADLGNLIRRYEYIGAGAIFWGAWASSGCTSTAVLVWNTWPISRVMVTSALWFLFEAKIATSSCWNLARHSRAWTSLLVLPFCAQKYMVVWCRVIRCKKNGGCWKLRRWNVHVADCLTFLLVERSSTSREWYRYIMVNHCIIRGCRSIDGPPPLAH